MNTSIFKKTAAGFALAALLGASAAVPASAAELPRTPRYAEMSPVNCSRRSTNPSLRSGIRLIPTTS